MTIPRWWADGILADLPEAFDKHRELQTLLALPRDGGRLVSSDG